jgi:hypothetical protein
MAQYPAMSSNPTTPTSTPTAQVPEQVVQILHAEAIHSSDRYDRVMQGQERILTVVVALVGASLGFAAAGNHQEIYAGLPLALGLIFTFLLQLYADAESRQIYLNYLQTLINGQLGDHKKTLVEKVNANEPGIFTPAAERDHSLLMNRPVVASRAPDEKNFSQPLVILAWGLAVVALFIKGSFVAHDARIPNWQEYVYYAAVGFVAIVMILATYEFLFTSRKRAEIAVGLA